MLDRDRLVANLIDLIRIPSVNPGDDDSAGDTTGEAAVAAYIAERLAAADGEVSLVEVAAGRPNLFGTIRGGSGPSLMLAGHTDTVGVVGYDTAFDAAIGGGMVHGRGACDMKAALAAFIEVADVIAEQGITPPGNIVIAGLADEEHTMLGSKAAGQQGPWCDAVVVGEPTALAIAPCHRGEIGIRITTYGEAAHSSRPELGVNAISHMAEIVRLLDDYPELLAAARPHPLAGQGSYSPGVISGGTMVSIVPDRCTLDIDRRILPGESADTVHTELVGLLADLDPVIRYEISGPIWENPPLDTPRDAAVVTELSGAHRSVVGCEASVVAVPYCTDGPNLGRPAVIYGPGSIDLAHTTNESVPIAEVVTAAEVYLEMAMTFGSRR